MKNSLDIRPSTRLLQVLGDIPLENWQCLAELIDNSLDELLTSDPRSMDDPLTVDIDIEPGEGSSVFVVVRDNGDGMSEDELERALRAGHSSKGRYGTLGLFGMGFNIATARLGDSTTVETTTKNSTEMLSATINFAELQRSESFSVPLVRIKCSAETSGTTVRVRLKKDLREGFGSTARQLTIAKQLGGVYTYLLRESIPGINRQGLSARLPARVRMNGVVIDPVLPCIWSDQRTVISSGMEVSAVQYIDIKLSQATACLDCGYWDRKNGPEDCDECGSRRLEKRDRRIWGWLGVQRYIDSGHYGIDFIRYGRKILSLDKSVFTYRDLDTLESQVEYPIEMPANQGRLVGEIHLDHVPVTYQKNDFDRQSREWQTAIEAIRGSGPLKPRGAAAINNSPLSKLYSAFRRNDPGLRYLTAHDGKQAIHNKTREWAGFFNKGVARYYTDEEWYESAARPVSKETKKDPMPGTNVEPKGAPATAGAGAVGKYLGSSATTPAQGTVAPNKPKVLTEQEIIDRARILGSKRDDLSAKFNLGGDLGSWKVTVITTTQELKDIDSTEPAPTRPGVITGSDIEIFVWEEHEIFREYGRDIRDAALLRVSEIIKGLSSTRLSATSIYAELVLSLPDLRTTDTVILERIKRIFERIRELTSTVISGSPEIFWGNLDAEDKTSIERSVAVYLPSVDVQEIADDGRFIRYTEPEGLIKLIKKTPDLFFGGKVFRPKVAGRSADARERVISNIVRDMSSLNDFQLDPLMRQKHDIAFALITLEHLENQLSSEDLYS